MIVELPKAEDGSVRVSLRTDRAAVHELTWRLPVDHQPDALGAADAGLIAALLPSMALEETLRAVAPVSKKLLTHVPTLQDILVAWSHQSELMKGVPPVFRHVAVEAEPRASGPAQTSKRVASFFTGGVDSFYTALKHREELSALVFVHGYDVPLDAAAQRARVSDGLRNAARQLDLPLIEVEADMRTFTDRYVDWLDAHGAALACVAQLLSPWFGRIYVPATESFATLRPLGSHPLIDPLWSTERVEVAHDGGEASRLEKLRAISGSEAARSRLRVCVVKDPGRYNCGRCWKCIDTMVGLQVLGAAGEFVTLPDPGRSAMMRRIAWCDAGEPARSWERHRTIWKPYVREERDVWARRQLTAALTFRYAWGRSQRQASKTWTSLRGARRRSRP